MYDVVYLNILEICDLLPSSTPTKDICPNKYYSFYDTIIIKNGDSILAVLSMDGYFVETLRHIKQDPNIIRNIFTPPCRCDIIKYNELDSQITLEELIKRYGKKI